ncbi:MAG TPA: 6-phosphogluconolactonase [Kofleriaceae bacterium]
MSADVRDRFQHRTFDDPETLAVAAADEFVAMVKAKSGDFHVALSGGSTPKKLFDVLANRGKAAVPWDRVVLWWGDERCVPPDDPDSNYGMTKQHLIDPLGLDPARIHRLEGERPPIEAAADYERALVGVLGAPPVFDLVWLGMGPDGHTASLFPNSPGVKDRSSYVIANAVDSPLTKGPTTRLTITLGVIDAARHVRFLVTGQDKATTLANVQNGPTEMHPSSLVTGSDTLWLIDRAAGTYLL